MREQLYINKHNLGDVSTIPATIVTPLHSDGGVESWPEGSEPPYWHYSLFQWVYSLGLNDEMHVQSDHCEWGMSSDSH